MVYKNLIITSNLRVDAKVVVKTINRSTGYTNRPLLTPRVIKPRSAYVIAA